MSNQICRGDQKMSRAARSRWSVLLVVGALLLPPVMWTKARSTPPSAPEPTLIITNGVNEQRLTLDQLLLRSDTVMLNVTGDIYNHAVTYRGLPLLAILGDSASAQFDTIEAEARDGFVSELPLALIRRGANGGSIAYLAIEDPAHPWPHLPKRGDTAGPFYLIWEHPERS